MIQTTVTHLMEFSHFSDRIVFSGAENHLFALMKGQVDAGLGVSLVMLVGTPGPALVEKADELAAQGIRVDRLEPARTEGKNLRRLARAATLPRLVSTLRQRRNQVIHTHLTLASQVGRIAAASAGCRRVVDSIHNNEPFFENLGWRARLLALDKVTRRYIAASRAIKEQLVENVGLKAERISVVHYGLPAPAELVARDDMRDRLGLPRERPVVGCVGRLTQQKNLGFFLEIIRSMSDIVGVLVGEGEERARLENLAREMRVDVRFLGYQPDGAATIGAFDALLLPSLWEGLGMVIIEAMQRRVPVLGSDRGAIPEVLGNGRFGRVLPLDSVDPWVKAIERLRSDNEETERMTQRAQQHSFSEFSVERMVEQTNRAYQAAAQTQ